MEQRRSGKQLVFGMVLGFLVVAALAAGVRLGGGEPSDPTGEHAGEGPVDQISPRLERMEAPNVKPQLDSLRVRSDAGRKPNRAD